MPQIRYAFYVLLHFTMPAPPVLIVPLYVNVYLPPQPTLDKTRESLHAS